MKRYGYVYITINSVNNKKYIGQHISSEFDCLYRGSGSLIVKAIKKYRKRNFKVTLLEWAYSLEELNSLEQKYIRKYNAVQLDEFYNLESGDRNCPCSEERIQKYKNTVYNTIESNGLTIAQNIGLKVSKSQNEIQENGKTKVQNSGKKFSKAVTTTIQENGLTIAQNIGRKSIASRKRIEDNGLTVVQNTNIKSAKVKKNTILPNGLSIAQDASIRAAKTMKKIESNGKTIKQNRLEKRQKTMAKIGEDGLNGFQRSSLRCKETKLKNKRNKK